MSQALSHRWTWSCFPDQMHREMVMSKMNDWLDLIHVCGSQDRNTLTHTYCYCVRNYSHSIFITKESVCFGCFCLSPGNLSNISVFRALLATLYLDTSIDLWVCVNWTVSKPTGSYARDENRVSVFFSINTCSFFVFNFLGNIDTYKYFFWKLSKWIEFEVNPLLIWIMT